MFNKMVKNVFVAALIGLGTLFFQSHSEAQYCTPYTSCPMSGYYPYSHMTAYPYYSTPYATCFAQGLYNGMIFYGVSYDVYYATQLAFYACQSTGQYCRFYGCR
jgi:hypothetical protein